MMQKTIAGKRTTLLALLLVAGAALLLASCNPGGVGIFYTLQNETRQTSTSVIGTDRTIGSMAAVGTTSSPVAYYIGAGNIYTSPAGSSPSWQKVSAPTVSYQYPITNQIVIDNTTTPATLYAVYYAANGWQSALYSAPVTGAETGPSWSPVSGFVGTTNTMIQSIFAVNSQLFVTTQYTDPASGAVSYNLYNVNTANPASSTLLLSGLQSPVTAGAFDGTDYWFVLGSTLYTGTSLTSTSLQAASRQPTLSLKTGEVFDGIYWSSTLSTLFVSTSAGGVYTHTSSGWSANIAGWPSNIAPTNLNGFAEVTVGTTDVLVIGSALGYYEWDFSPPFSASGITSELTLLQPGNNTTLTASVNYVSSNLAAAAILGFFNNGDAASTNLFALTDGYGLWLDQPDSSGNRAWTQE